jgi:DNA-binding NarL/FixJ family response regulator
MRVIIADDHPLVLAGFGAMISDRPEFELIGAYQNGGEALEAIERLRPHIAVLDQHMPHLTGPEVLQAVRERNLPSRIVLISAIFRAGQAEAAAAAGAQGILRKDAAPDELISCLLQVGRGGTWLPTSEDQSRLENEAPALTLLTAREKVIVGLAVKGLTNKDIARQLDLTEGTVKVHIYNVFKKAGLRNRTELANLFRRLF